jgi:uncharacterized membrane protein required for colicin V production
MVELSLLVWFLAAFFAYLGALRGWTKEVISSAGIVLGLFALYQFDNLIRFNLFGDLPLDQKFYLQTMIFLAIVFFAYQTRAIVGADASRSRSGSDGRDNLQTRVLGGIVGFINGYLIGGTIWYFLDINRLPNGAYPLDPFVSAPLPGTASAQALQNLPLYVLTQNGASGDLLSLAVVVLFVIVLVLI